VTAGDTKEEKRNLKRTPFLYRISASHSDVTKDKNVRKRHLPPGCPFEAKELFEKPLFLGGFP
jgi:hypothetical protein